MDMLSTILIFIITLILAKLLSKKYLSDNTIDNLPPCLPHIPLLGSLPFFASFEVLHIFLTDKSKQLGNVFGMYLADTYTVVLNGQEALHEGLVKNAIAFADRPRVFTMNFANVEQRGIVENRYTDKFKKLHYFSLSILKKFGFGQSIMEDRIKEEVEEMINQIDKTNGLNFDPCDIITVCVFNVVLSIISAKRMHSDDPKFREIVRLTYQRLRQAKDPKFLNFFPFLRFLPRFKRSIQMYSQNDRDIRISMQEKIQESHDEKECFISYFIKEAGKEYENEDLIYVCRDLFLAGTETASSTLLWLITLLANNQDVQKKAQKEIDSVVGRDHLPTLDDKNKLRYVEAVIMESMRWKTIVPLALPHWTISDTVIQGFKIPAKTMIIPNIYSVHMDEKIWKDPQIFRPERFIDINGDIINKNKFMAFSLGKRACFGESLARQEIFLFSSTLLQNYHILPPDGQDKIVVEENVGVSISPKAFTCRLIKR